MLLSATGDKLSTRDRAVLIKLCNDRLAEAVDLQLQCKHAYWNTRDPNLISLRNLFDQVNEAIEDYIDRIAERSVEIGGIANSTEYAVATWSNLLCDPDAIRCNHAETIVTSLAVFGDRMRQAVEISNQFSDLVSANIFTEISKGVEGWRGKLAAQGTG